MRKSKSKVSTGFEKRIMERISHEKILMKSQPQMLVKKWGKIMVPIVFIGLSIFFVSLGLDRMTIPKIFGTKFLIQYFPWVSMALGISFFLLGFAFVEKFKLMYKWTLPTLMLYMAVLVLVLSYGTHKADLHAKLSQSPLQFVYSLEKRPFEIVGGHVIEVRTSQSFLFQTISGKRLRVILPSNVIISSGTVSIDDSLLIAGSVDSGSFIPRAILNLTSRK